MVNSMVIYKTDSCEINVEYLYTVGGYVTYDTTVVSAGFRGCTNFCLSIEDIANYSKKIELMLRKLCGNITIQDCESDSYLEFGFINNRKLMIQGQIGGSHESHMMKFECEVDQTILVGLKRELQYE